MKAIAGRPGVRENSLKGRDDEPEGSTDAADRIRRCPWWTGRGPLGLPDSPTNQQGTGRGAAFAGFRSGKAERYSDPAAGSHHRRLSARLIADGFFSHEACLEAPVYKHLRRPRGGASPVRPASKLGGRARLLANPFAHVGHNCIENDHELGRAAAFEANGLNSDVAPCRRRHFSRQFRPDIALIPRPPADTVPRAPRA
jgi:hypothetical protein